MRGWRWRHCNWRRRGSAGRGWRAAATRCWYQHPHAALGAVSSGHGRLVHVNKQPVQQARRQRVQVRQRWQGAASAQGGARLHAQARLQRVNTLLNGLLTPPLRQRPPLQFVLHLLLQIHARAAVAAARRRGGSRVPAQHVRHKLAHGGGHGHKALRVARLYSQSPRFPCILTLSLCRLPLVSLLNAFRSRHLGALQPHIQRHGA